MRKRRRRLMHSKIGGPQPRTRAAKAAVSKHVDVVYSCCSDIVGVTINGRVNDSESERVGRAILFIP